MELSVSRRRARKSICPLDETLRPTLGLGRKEGKTKTETC